MPFIMGVIFVGQLLIVQKMPRRPRDLLISFANHYGAKPVANSQSAWPRNDKETTQNWNKLFPFEKTSGAVG